MTLPRTAATAADYIASAHTQLGRVGPVMGTDGKLLPVLLAMVDALLANAAATLEAAALMGPTPDDQRRLDELVGGEQPFFCHHEWPDSETTYSDADDLHPGKPHRCGFMHPHTDAHGCYCGAKK